MKDNNAACLRKHRSRNYIYAPVRSSSTITSGISKLMLVAPSEKICAPPSRLRPTTIAKCSLLTNKQQTACNFSSCEKYSGFPGYAILIMLFLLSIVLVMFMSILTPKRGKMDKICKVKLLNPFVQIDCTQPPH